MTEKDTSYEYMRCRLGVLVELRDTEPAKALLGLKELFRNLKDMGYTRIEDKTISNIAECHYQAGELRSALEEYTLLKDRYLKHGELIELGHVNNWLAIVYRDMADYGQSMNCYLEAYRYFSEAGDKEGVIGSSLNIGLLKRKLGQMKEAREYYEHADKLCREEGTLHQKALAAMGLASIECYESKFNQAIQTYSTALRYYRQIEDQKGENACLNNIGLTYERSGDYKSAFEFYELALHLSTITGEKLKQAIAYCNMGNVKSKRKEYKEARKLLALGLKFAKEMDAREIIMENYAMYYNLFKQQEDFEKALHFHELFREEKDAIYSKNMQQKLSELMIKYETEAKEKEAEIYRLKNIDLKEKNKLIESQKKELQELNEKLKIKNEILFNAAIMDKLTGVYNRAYTIELFEKELERSKRYGWETGVILLDIDWFKKINDNYGHLTGDFVLREVAQAILETVRKSDIFGRFGGEEFLIILPNTSLRQTETAGEKIRKIIEGKCFKKDDEKINITVSLGVAGSPQSGNCLMDELIQLADDALYEAKGKGRNCLCVSEAIKENKTSAK